MLHALPNSMSCVHVILAHAKHEIDSAKLCTSSDFSLSGEHFGIQALHCPQVVRQLRVQVQRVDFCRLFSSVLPSHIRTKQVLDVNVSSV